MLKCELICLQEIIMFYFTNLMYMRDLYGMIHMELMSINRCGVI